MWGWVLGVWDWGCVSLSTMVTQFVPPKSGSVGFVFGSVGFGLRQSEHDGDTVRAAKVLGVWGWVSVSLSTMVTQSVPPKSWECGVWVASV